ncbi:MAG: dehydrogenase [Devosia sp.]|uniref:bi-domain-containing oxidoreductase n=1 Tax=Devosia sp. TaxID=1871048 RepID=UPI00261DA031|nr:bi-domain-containing oxidoreductase [Devosia sp.]MDB5526958.1 dehydrogenase [Devosia sp.]
MKQVLQSLRTGATDVADVPSPDAGPGQVLIRTSSTLVSAGTERMLVAFGRANLLDKARQQPERVRQVLDKMRTDGVLPTIETVFNKLDQPLPLGYCNVGVVLEAGTGVNGLVPGDRVVSNGKHAEVVAAPRNLCALVPASVSDDEAAFTVLGAIALQGIRLINPGLGECVVVTGLGLVGLMAVQLLVANGCRVLGIDFDSDKLALARQFGAETVDLSAGGDPIAAAAQFSRGRGVDAVLITASTKSSEPVHQAAQMSRQRGRIVLVGVTGLELLRSDFYEKELTFQVSCSYGPGRYDSSYEEGGVDYPIGFVRWTEQRNFEAVLDMLANRRLDVRPLISHRFAIEDAAAAYDVVDSTESSLGILLDYPAEAAPALRARTVTLDTAVAASTKPGLAFIGAGNYAGAVLIPAFKATSGQLRTVASSGGVNGLHLARKFGFRSTTTDTQSIFADANVDAVVIATRHDSHARLAVAALQAGKHVYVEKPVAMTLDELTQIEAAHKAAPDRLLMVGFNRRFAPQIVRVKQLLRGTPGAKAFTMTVNAGHIPTGHWTQDQSEGGGRIIGEACHFIDLLRHLAGVPITSHSIAGMASTSGDTVTIGLRFEDGSIGTIHYFANGPKSLPKERLEVFVDGRVLQLDNFRRLKGFGWPGFKALNLWKQDKGQRAAAAAFIAAIETGGAPPIATDELLEVGRVTIEIASSL